MIILDATTTKLQAVLGGAIITNQVKYAISYTDLSGATITPGISTATSNSTTAVDILAAPAASTQRLIKNISVENADTGPVTITFQIITTGPVTNVTNVFTLQVGDNLIYEDGAGWLVLDSNGQFKTSGPLSGSLIRAPQYLTAGTSYTIPTGCNAIEIEMIGGGGAGGGTTSTASQCAVGSGGSAGSYLRKYIGNPQASAITYAIGAGAAGVSGGAGGAGGATSFTCTGVTYTAGGGGAGGVMVTGTGILATTAAASTTSSGGDLNGRGMNGLPGYRASGTVGISGNGGSSIFGGGGLGLSADGAGNTAQGYGAGGGGSCSLATTNYAGGNGSQGLIIVREYY